MGVSYAGGTARDASCFRARIENKEKNEELKKIMRFSFYLM